MTVKEMEPVWATSPASTFSHITASYGKSFVLISTSVTAKQLFVMIFFYIIAALSLLNGGAHFYHNDDLGGIISIVVGLGILVSAIARDRRRRRR